MPLDDHLQYPQTDRRLCNAVHIPENIGIQLPYSILKRIVAFATNIFPKSRHRVIRLTVSSNGSSPLQPFQGWSIPVMCLTYSIPNGSSPLQPFQGWSIPVTCLTYSILKRIVASATFPRMVYPSDVLDLQYPQTDRRLCNLSKDGLSQ